MPKEKPYPLRLEQKQEAILRDVMRATVLTKAFILRMAVDVGLKHVDWARLTSPPLVGEKNAADVILPPARATSLALNEATKYSPIRRK